MKVDKLLAQLGYGARREVAGWVRAGRVTDDRGDPVDLRAALSPDRLRLDGQVLDPGPPYTIALHKPVGFVCSAVDPGATVYDLLPPRYRLRRPALAPIGRLDKETSGLLLLTDDGDLNHALTHPRRHVAKVYEVELDRPLSGSEAARFAAGDLVLRGEDTPLLPAGLVATGPRSARVTVHEGRYHQVRRMFAAVGNHVVALRRVAIGGLALPADLPEGAWRALTADELGSIRGP